MGGRVKEIWCGVSALSHSLGWNLLRPSRLDDIPEQPGWRIQSSDAYLSPQFAAIRASKALA
jgi:hypothetical protein